MAGQSTPKHSEKAELKPVGFRLHEFIHGLTRIQKRVILSGLDAVLLGFSVYVAVALRIGFPTTDYLKALIPSIMLGAVGGVLVFWLLGFYNTLIRAFDFRTINQLASGVLITSLLLAAFGYFDTSFSVPRSVPIIFILVAFFLIASSRVGVRWYYNYSLGSSLVKEKVLIYGDSEISDKIASMLSGSTEYSVVGFLTDDTTLRGHYLRGRRIYPINEFEEALRLFGAVRILICLPDFTPEQKRRIIQTLQNYPVKIDIVPAPAEILFGKAQIDDMREIQIDDLLEREKVKPIDRFFRNAIEGKIIFISGAGGSIGSELCQQILGNDPVQLVCFDQSELALYKLEQTLKALLKKQGASVPVSYHLGNVCDRVQVAGLLARYRPDVVYHAAAYKHVPMVEENIVAGAHNNIIGTWVMASESLRAKANRFILISTDKAVRPLNVMGATKRVAEQIVQAHSRKRTNCVFSMVRFGNVLGSSGSVIPLFKSQIDSGRPVTVTHRDVTRYFMTISEAAQLVIQAGFLAEGGEVFVLDMGEPVRIAEMAALMIRLSGRTVRNAENPVGDIEITYTGLRPGEKMAEELLISENASGTLHPKILRANEKSISFEKMTQTIEKLQNAIDRNNPASVLEILRQLVEGFSNGADMDNGIDSK